MDRRDFMKLAGGTILVISSGTYAFQFLTGSIRSATGEGIDPNAVRWGMVIDLTKCQEGCTACLDACRQENNVALHGDPKLDVHWIRKVKAESMIGNEVQEKSILLLCNHCDKPPCAQVCPVQATYRRHDGIVIVDHHRCIGCRYCMIACPYNARQFNLKDNEHWANKERPKRSHGVAEACTLCAHRLDVGKPPACVEACQNVGAGAIMVGNLNDANSEVSQIISRYATKRLREELGTEPKVHYVGL
ncbi:MAG: 4Fe-4S dicluster domain-containing protein [Candidatus Zixiibacteriota bacterium]